MGRRRVLRLKDATAFARHAMSMGATATSAASWRWDCARGCLEPRTIQIEGRYDPATAVTADPFVRAMLDAFPGAVIEHVSPASRAPAVQAIWVDMIVKCRRCDACLRARSQEWAFRANAEIKTTWRTWFGTLTLSPDNQVKALYRAQLKARRGGTSWQTCVGRRPGEDALAYAGRVSEAQFKLLHAAISPELTRWLKRVRKESGAKLRYLLVAEAHKSGLPHYHILISESSETGTVRKRTLQSQWKLGFSQFKLVGETDGAARYVCKYLAKAAEARVRASLRYGRSLREQNPKD